MAHQRARHLRKNATTPERVLWAALRNLMPAGLHFRRQAPIGDYVVDFVCHSARLVVEVDGSQHGTEQGLSNDAMRSAFLESRGYRVLRFWNVDVIHNSKGIAEAIHAAARTPTRNRFAISTSPQGGGEN
jgi:very-short-patch-repair endonuclease